MTTKTNETKGTKRTKGKTGKDAGVPTALPASYAALVARAVELGASVLRAFESDLTVHDLNACLANPTARRFPLVGRGVRDHARVARPPGRRDLGPHAAPSRWGVLDTLDARSRAVLRAYPRRLPPPHVRVGRRLASGRDGRPGRLAADGRDPRRGRRGRVVNDDPRHFRVVWIVDPTAYRKRFRADPTTIRGVHCPGPFTHAEACAVLRKLNPQSWRRDLLDVIQGDPS